MPFPDGPWGSYIRMAPVSAPNDGVVRINTPNANGDFDGEHFRPPFELTPISQGQYTPATGGNLAHITFRETYNGVTYEYDADIIMFRTNLFVTFDGRRRQVPAGTAADDEWVGTHTT